MMKNRYKIVLEDIGYADVSSFGMDDIISIIKTMRQIRQLLDETPKNYLGKVDIYNKIKELRDIDFLFVEESLLESISYIAPQEYVDNNPKTTCFSICEENGKWVTYKKTKTD